MEQMEMAGKIDRAILEKTESMLKEANVPPRIFLTKTVPPVSEEYAAALHEISYAVERVESALARLWDAKLSNVERQGYRLVLKGALQQAAGFARTLTGLEKGAQDDEQGDDE